MKGPWSFGAWPSASSQPGCASGRGWTTLRAEMHLVGGAGPMTLNFLLLQHSLHYTPMRQPQPYTHCADEEAEAQGGAVTTRSLPQLASAGHGVTLANH